MSIELRNPTDDELRDEWIRKYPHTIYCRSQFYRYTNGTYRPVDEMVINKEISSILVSAKGRGVKPTSALVGSVRTLAMSEIFKDPNLLDSNSDIFAFQNGVFNLKTQKFSEHSPENYVSIVQDYDYDPEATSPYFMSVIHRFDRDTQLFLQEFAGYCTTTQTNLETMLWLSGRPGSGKSTLIKGFEAFLGRYCGYLPPHNFNGNRFGFSNVVGARLLVATEVPKKGIEDTSILKAFVSGETISVEKKFANAYSYKPLAKFMWAMNTVPAVDFLTDGIGRRVQIIEFPDLQESERDPYFVNEIMKEGPGIFNWARKGLISLRARGNFVIPESCKQTKDKCLHAPAKFLTPIDTLGEFVKTKCLVSDGHKSQAGLLGIAIKEFCREQGAQELNSTQISVGLQQLGYRKSPHHGTNYYHGLSIINKDE